MFIPYYNKMRLIVAVTIIVVCGAKIMISFELPLCFLLI